tara:strand:+ start:36 stop:476 length:441 start_codon:yes stop_codon:yes gene_type:complete
MKQIVLFFSFSLLVYNSLGDCQSTDCKTLSYIFSLEIPNVPFDHEGNLITIVDKYHLARNCDSVEFSKSFNIVNTEDSLVLKNYYFLDSIITAFDPYGDIPEYRVVYFSNSQTDIQLELIIEISGDEIGGVGVNYLDSNRVYLKNK